MTHDVTPAGDDRADGDRPRRADRDRKRRTLRRRRTAYGLKIKGLLLAFLADNASIPGGKAVTVTVRSPLGTTVKVIAQPTEGIDPATGTYQHVRPFSHRGEQVLAAVGLDFLTIKAIRLRAFRTRRAPEDVGLINDLIDRGALAFRSDGAVFRPDLHPKVVPADPDAIRRLRSDRRAGRRPGRADEEDAGGEGGEGVEGGLRAVPARPPPHASNRRVV